MGSSVVKIGSRRVSRWDEVPDVSGLVDVVVRPPAKLGMRLEDDLSSEEVWILTRILEIAGMHTGGDLLRERLCDRLVRKLRNPRRLGS